MRTHDIMALGLLAAVAAGPALADLSATDNQFANEAAQGGLAEVEMGQVAVQKATSAHVKQFAQRMVTDHTQANQELMQLATSQKLKLPTQVDAKHKSAMDKLRGLNGAAFDTAYMQDMVQDHEHDLAEFQKQA
jgi:putative membrane protein